ncbi:hypothetical protein FQN57_007243 [Myotisia sp. PD_48]|nr:hypothetical protein FQN57_007243 [Myotisia sp. PD_48]
MDHAMSGADALSKSDFPAAIKSYTHALIVNPHATDYYIKRSTAYSRLKPEDGGPNVDAALHDAEMAVALGVRRARLEQIVAGQMRRAIILYQNGRYADAQHIFKLVRDKVGHPNASRNVQEAMAAKDPVKNDIKLQQQALQMWEIKVESQLAKLDEEQKKVTVKDIPDIRIPSEEELKGIYRSQIRDNTLFIGLGKESTPVKDTIDESLPVADSTAQPTKPTPQLPNIGKTRYEWYQSNENVVVTLYAKGVPEDKAEIDIQDHSISISFPLASGSEYNFTLDPFFAEVDAHSSKIKILPTKVEMTLQKKFSGRKWPTLEGTAKAEKVASSITTATSAQAPSASTTTNTVPVYPTSSKSGAKDWDKVVSDLTKEKKPKQSGASKDTEKEGNHEEEEEDLSDYGGSDEVDSFFKKLYANSDPDTRRAMVKSYYESGGTALSTNWGEVGKGPVHPQPPSES